MHGRHVHQRLSCGRSIQSLGPSRAIGDRNAMSDNPWKSSGFTRLARASGSSLRDMRFGLVHDSAIRQTSIVSIFLVVVSLFLPVSNLEKVVLVQSTLIVPLIEYINSAIESAVDRTSLEKHPLAAQAKELASVAVGLAVLIAAIAWVVIV